MFKYALKTVAFILLIGNSLFADQRSSTATSPLTQEEKTNLINKESQETYERSLRLTRLYELPAGQEIKDITQDVLESPDVSQSKKDNLILHERKIFLFQYPSDGLMVKGFISLTPNSQHQPLLILLRGGNRLFGLLNPSLDLASYKDYTTISTTYRDGLNEGKDQFGGDDVNDVENLVLFMPALEKMLNVSFQPSHVFMLGASRGALQMFLALARYPDLQQRVDKVVSLSGVLDLRRQMKDRPDMKTMFEQEFGLTADHEEEWINERNPIQTVPLLDKSLPILILQGNEDLRVNLEEGYHMTRQLQENGNNVSYMEIEQGDHTLANKPDRMDLIAGWLELESKS